MLWLQVHFSAFLTAVASASKIARIERYTARIERYTACAAMFFYKILYQAPKIPLIQHGAPYMRSGDEVKFELKVTWHELLIWRGEKMSEKAAQRKNRNFCDIWPTHHYDFIYNGDDVIMTSSLIFWVGITSLSKCAKFHTMVVFTLVRKIKDII